MRKNPISIAIIEYPGVLRSAMYGLEELFLLANAVIEDRRPAVEFFPQILGLDAIRQRSMASRGAQNDPHFHLVILPPSLASKLCETPDRTLSAWLSWQHEAGAVLCSVCAGAFLLAATGLLHKRRATTH